MSTRKKGNQAEKEYKKKLELQGYKVIKAPMTNKYNAQVDFFNYWDLIAYNKEEWLVVQVKSGKSNLMIKHYKAASEELPVNTRALLVHRKLDKSRRVKWRMIELNS